MKTRLLITSFLDHAFGVNLKWHCYIQAYSDFLLGFSSKSMITLHFTFRSVIHFKLVFMKIIKSVTRFIIFHVDVQLCQHNLLKDCLCFIVLSLLLCQSSADSTYVGLLLGCLFCSIDVFVCTIRFSVQFSHSVMSNSLRPHEPQHARPPCLSPTPRVHPNPCPLSQWCHPTVSSSVVPLSSCPQSFPASVSFQWVHSSHQVAKVLEFQLQHQSFQWTPRTDLP